MKIVLGKSVLNSLIHFWSRLLEFYSPPSLLLFFLFFSPVAFLLSNEFNSRVNRNCTLLAPLVVPSLVCNFRTSLNLTVSDTT